MLWTGFASTEKINLNFAPWGAYMFLKHFLFATYLPVAILSRVKIDPSDKHSEKFCVNIGPETIYWCILMVHATA